MGNEKHDRPESSRYRYVTELGRGGMGTVWEALRKLASGREQRVAIKRILPEYAAREDVIAYFEREADVTLELAHPNVVEVYDFDREDGEQLLIMEFVDGEALSSLADRGPLEPKFVREVLRAILQALVYVHGRGIAHRDLTMGNVLISHKGEVKVTDFGLARWLASPASGKLHGTTAYASPERIQGIDTGELEDLYSAAVIAFWLLAGGPPYGRVESQIYARMVVRARAPLPDDVPADLLEVIDGVMTGVEERTLHSAADMLGVLYAPSASAAETAAMIADAKQQIVARDEVIALEPGPGRRGDTVPDADREGARPQRQQRQRRPRRMRWALAAAALASAIAFVTLRGNDSPEQFAPLDPRAQDAPAESAADESAAEEADEATTDTPPSPAPTAVERPAPEPPANNHALPIGPRRAVVVGPRKRQPSPATQARPAKRADTPETSSKRPAVGRADWPRDGSWQLSVDQGNP